MSSYVAVLVAQCKPANWNDGALLMRFVEQSGISTAFIVSGAAVSVFEKLESWRIYEMQVPGECVRQTNSQQSFGIQNTQQVVMKSPCKVNVATASWPFQFPYQYQSWPSINQLEPDAFLDIYGKVISDPVNDVNSDSTQGFVLCDEDLTPEEELLGEHADARELLVGQAALLCLSRTSLSATMLPEAFAVSCFTGVLIHELVSFLCSSCLKQLLSTSAGLVKSASHILKVHVDLQWYVREPRRNFFFKIPDFTLFPAVASIKITLPTLRCQNAGMLRRILQSIPRSCQSLHVVLPAIHLYLLECVLLQWLRSRTIGSLTVCMTRGLIQHRTFIYVSHTHLRVYALVSNLLARVRDVSFCCGGFQIDKESVDAKLGMQYCA